MMGWVRSFYGTVFDDDGGHIGWFLATFSLVLVAAIAATVAISLSMVVHVSTDKPPITTYDASKLAAFVGLSLLVGTAGFAGGGMLGFLFGVPRVRSAPAANGDLVDSNTNLEQVSDWLTKIVVGVTLVQFHAINGLFVQFSWQVDQSVKGAGLPACLILIATGIAGFLAAYLKARTELMTAFGSAIQKLRGVMGQATQVTIEDEGRRVLNGSPIDVDPAVKAAAAKVIEATVPTSKDPSVLRLAGLAHAILKNFAASAESLKRSLDLKADPEVQFLAVRAFALAGKADDAQTLSSPTMPTPGQTMTSSQIEGVLAAMFAGLYDVHEGFKRTIALGEQLARNGSAEASGRLWLYLSAAYGQQHAWLLATPTTSMTPEQVTAHHASIDNCRAEALEAVQNALKVNRAVNLPILQLLLSGGPGKNPTENDLETFANDPDFQDLLKTDK